MRNASLVTPAGVLERDLLVENARFSAIVGRDEASGADWQEIDAAGRLIFPGLIDLLQHGYEVNLYNDVTPGGVARSSELLLARGVTGFLPSISCLAPGVLERTLAGLSGEIAKARGARALGIHSEGPCFGSPGAHNPQNIQLPSLALAERMLAAADGRLRAVTVAPEVPGAEDFIRTLKRAGVSIHFGHSRAKAEDIPRYLSWGIDAVTHMYNVMPPLAPDMSGVHPFSLPDALLAERGLRLGLICDGIHVHPKLVALLAQLPADRVFLETDANKYAGTEGAEFEFYPGYWVKAARGNAVRDRDGGLCGSSLTPDEAMHNYRRFAGVDLVQAAAAGSLVPAQVIGMGNELGSIEVGKLADFAVLDATTLEVEATYVGGEPLYRRQDREGGMSEGGDKPLRYQEEGNVHLDFHGAINTTIDFIVSRYGVAAMHEIFSKVGRDVYVDLRRHLEAGDAGELVRHWRYFFEREQADFDISVGEDEIVLTVRRCPAWHHVRKIAPSVSPHFCDQTIVTNNALAAGSPFAIDTRVTGEGACVQSIRRRA